MRADVARWSAWTNSQTARAADTPALADRGRLEAALLIGIATALMTFGVIMIYSAGVRVTADDATRPFLSRASGRQLLFALATVVVMVIASRVPYTIWRWRDGRWFQPSVLLFGLTLGLLGLVFVPGIGKEMNGARRWIDVGGELQFQPSELAKLSMPILLAAWFASRRHPIWKFATGMLPACVVIGLAGAAVGKEDFGTAALLAGIGGVVFLVAGARLWDVVLLAVPACFGLYHLVVAEPYRVQRITMFTRIWDDPLGKGYHQVQSLCTIGSGGWLGRGLGMGIQKYGYLPESQTDSIFAVICEELGMPGALLVIALFIALLWQGRRIVQSCRDPFGRFLATAITLTLVLQAAMNIAVVTVSVPTKGIALPFVSKGGSGTLFLGLMVGVLANIARRSAAGGPAPPGRSAA